MGTYTTNYNLFMPSIGEQGWGTLVNGNFSTIDTTMKELDTRLITVENEVNGNLSCTSVTTSGTIESMGLITANGGVKGALYVNGQITTIKMSNYSPVYAGTLEQTITVSCRYNATSTSSTIIASAPTILSITYPVRVGPGIYIRTASDIKSGSIGSVSRSVSLTVTNASLSSEKKTRGRLYVNGSSIGEVVASGISNTSTATYTINSGDDIYVTATGEGINGVVTATISADTTHYLDGI